MAIQEQFKVFIADNKFLCFSQGILTSVLPFDEQALEYLKTEGTWLRFDVFTCLQ